MFLFQSFYIYMVHFGMPFLLCTLCLSMIHEVFGASDWVNIV